MYSLLGYNIEIIPVPRNKNYTANPGETEVASDYVKEFILSKTEIVPDENISTSSSSNNNNNNEDNNVVEEEEED